MAKYNYWGNEFISKEELMDFYYEKEEQLYLEDILLERCASEILQNLNIDFLEEIYEETIELFMERVKVIDDEEEEEGE